MPEAHEARTKVHKELEDLKKILPAPATGSFGASEVERLRTSVKELVAHMKEEAARASATEPEVRSICEEVTALMAEKQASRSL